MASKKIWGMARKLDPAQKSGLGKWGIRGEWGPGTCWGFMNWGPFGSHLGPLLFGAHFRPIWNPFWAHLGPFGAHFCLGPILGPFGPSLLSPFGGAIGFCIFPMLWHPSLEHSTRNIPVFCLVRLQAPSALANLHEILQHTMPLKIRSLTMQASLPIT